MMCGTRRNYYLIFITLVVFTLTATEGQTKKKCAEFNEYCQNHWDCCSNSCMSYLYRCTRNYNIYPYPIFGENVPVTGTFEDIIAATFGLKRPNEIGEEREKEKHKINAFEYSKPTTTNSWDYEEQTTTAFGENDPKSAYVKQQRHRRQAVSATEQEQQEHNDSVTAAATADADANVEYNLGDPCKEIGEKCYRNEECCTERCHGFLHQCVT